MPIPTWACVVIVAKRKIAVKKFFISVVLIREDGVVVNAGKRVVIIGSV